RSDDEAAWEAFCWLGVVAEDAVLSAPMAANCWGVDEAEAKRLLEILWNDALISAGMSGWIGGQTWSTFRMHSLLHDMALHLLTSELGFTIERAHVVLLQRYQRGDIPLSARDLRPDGYIHAHLVWHLERAGNIEAIHALLREESPHGGNAWQEARERLHDMPGFLEDIARAWQLAQTQTERELAEGKPA